MKRNQNKNNQKSTAQLIRRSKEKKRSEDRSRRKRGNGRGQAGANAPRYTTLLTDSRGDRPGYGGPRRRPEERLLVGKLIGHRSGFGFVPAAEGEDDIFVPATHMNGALDGDTVELGYRVYDTYYGGRQRTEGRVRRILEPRDPYLVGTLVSAEGRRGRMVFLPDDPRLCITPAVDRAEGATIGDKVRVLLYRGRVLGVRVVENFGRADSFGANYKAVLAEARIETEFTEEELAAAAQAAKRPLSPQGREDLRAADILTIDGADAKDLDDAVSLTCGKDGSFLLSVHIADVSTYVGDSPVLRDLAMRRGTSVYFTDKVVPMLPEALSNGACSLNAGEDKYALTAHLTLSAEGELLETKLSPTIIRSKVRGVYSEVNDIFEQGKASAYYEKYKPVMRTLQRMKTLYELLARKSRQRGMLELQIPEAYIALDARGTPVQIQQRTRGVGEKMIEQFMLTANEGVATLLSRRGIPCVYRVHASPPPQKLEDFLGLCHNLGFDATTISKDKCTPADLEALLTDARKRGLEEAVSYPMLRAMSKAEYSAVQAPHFGLCIPIYCHFTSPIRRLSDLATHRIIHRVLLDGRTPAAYRSFAAEAAQAATEGELRAVSAERKIDELYKAVYMQKHIGERFTGHISSVTAFGLFVMPQNTCEGLVPTESLPGVYLFDEPTQTLRGAHGHYRVGDPVTVIVEEADTLRGRIRYALADASEEEQT